MADNTAPNTPEQNRPYDPIQMLRDYLNDNPTTPGFFRNFLINRLGDQIVWYDRKSAYFKKKWERFRMVIIILSASIPFLVGLISENFDANVNLGLKLIIGAAGVMIAILEGLNSLFKSQELYVDYRVTAEQLRQEFSYFLGQAGDYAVPGEPVYAKLVAKVEGLVASQNNQWAQVARQNDRAAMTGDIEKFVQEYLRKYGYQIPDGASTRPLPADAPPANEPPVDATPPET